METVRVFGKNRPKKKADVIKLIKRLSDPHLVIGSDITFSLPSNWFFIHDRDNLETSIELPGCRMVDKCHLTVEDIESYDKRVEKLTEKYNRWILEAKNEL